MSIKWEVKDGHTKLTLEKCTLVFSEYPTYIHIFSVNTEADSRNKGLASKLIESVKNRGKKVTISTGYTDFHVKFWKKRGFKIERHITTDLVEMVYNPPKKEELSDSEEREMDELSEDTIRKHKHGRRYSGKYKGRGKYEPKDF